MLMTGLAGIERQH